jgi:hypothetical protein
MAGRRRTKPVQEHIEASAEQAPETTSQEAASEPVPESATVPEQPSPVMTTAEAQQEERKAPFLPTVPEFAPDPRPIEEISLDADDRKGPHMRLARSYRHREALIQFDKKPDSAVIGRLKNDGWRWESRAEVSGRQGAWAKPLAEGHEIRTMLDAETLFREIGNEIRAAKGLDAVAQGHSAA